MYLYFFKNKISYNKNLSVSGMNFKILIEITSLSSKKDVLIIINILTFIW